MGVGHEDGRAGQDSGDSARGVVTVESVEAVDESSGLYLARSRSSLHVFDLDASAYLRLPGERSNAFPHDVSVLRLTRVERPAHVGDTFFIWIDSPAEYAVWDYWRQSSPIAAIYRVRSAGQQQGRGKVEGGRGAGRTAAPGSAAAAPVSSELGPPQAPIRGAWGATAHPGPGQAEVLPGLEVAVDGLWQMVTSSETLLDARGSRLRPRPVLVWPLTSDEEWLTLLVLYQLEEGELMQAHLEVRRAAGTSTLRSTSPLTFMRLVVPEQPPPPTRRPDP